MAGRLLGTLAGAALLERTASPEGILGSAVDVGRLLALGAMVSSVVSPTIGVFESDREELLGLGFDGFVVKPYRDATIFREIAEQLGVSYVREAPDRGAGAAAELRRLLRAYRFDEIPRLLEATTVEP